jgi:hypothetical protein
MTTPEVLEMVDHIWELGQTHFDYFYFHENCSYHLLSILEVARPELKLTDAYPLYTIPADTIRLLYQEGLIDEGKRRESTYSRLVRLSANLNQEELNSAKQIAAYPETVNAEVSGKDSLKSARILDVAMEAFDYQNFDQILKDDPKTKEAKSHLLKARAINPEITNVDEKLETIKKDSPARSHSPTRWTLAQNYFDKQGKGTRIEYRAALHDLMDPLQGSMRDAQLEIGKFSFELQDQQYSSPKFVLDNFSIFNIKNFPEQNFWSSPLSWEIDLGVKQIRKQCFNCPATFVNGSVGNSLSLFNQKVLLAFLLNGEMNIQSQFINNYRAGLGPKIYSRFKFTDSWFLGIQSFYHLNTFEHDKAFQDYEWWNELELRHHLTERISLSLKSGGIERDRKWQNFGEFGLLYFYH